MRNPAGKVGTNFSHVNIEDNLWLGEGRSIGQLLIGEDLNKQKQGQGKNFDLLEE